MKVMLFPFGLRSVFNTAMACVSIVNDSMDAYHNHKLFGDEESRL